MADLLRVVLYGILPAMAAALLLVGRFGPRWSGLAAGLGMFAALGLLRGLPAWPHRLWSGNNDSLQWLCWCALAGGLLGAACGGRFPPRWLAVPAGVAALFGELWLVATNLRRRWDLSAESLHLGTALVVLAVAWIGARRAIEQRRGALVGWWLTAILSGDSAVLLLSGSALQGQLAGAVAAAFGAASGTALWRHPFAFDRAVALPFALAHGGLLFAGQQFSELPAWSALLAAVAPAALAVAGRPQPGIGGAGRQTLGVLAAAGLMGGAIAIALAHQP